VAYPHRDDAASRRDLSETGPRRRVSHVRVRPLRPLGAIGNSERCLGKLPTIAAYTGQLNPWAPAVLIPPLAWFVTVAEIVFGIALLLGLRTREVALASGVLLGLFALGLTVGIGLKSALNYSVFAASAGALALATERSYRWSLDALLASRARGEGERAAGRRQQREYACRKHIVHPQHAQEDSP
jgi:uncharacterized membrane protein YphA (DoxX/SURF4 family)